MFTADYQNEVEVGEALAEAFKSGLVKREDLFITTKVWVYLLQNFYSFIWNSFKSGYVLITVIDYL